MAGAGYKLFNTGDVLTAAQVNTYLQEQTVMVFASSTARTTALSGVLAEGMVSYLQDTNAVEVYNGSAWVGVSGAGDVTEVQAGTGISVASGTGPIPVVTNTMATAINAAGDIIYGTANDTFTRLGIGTAGQVLKVNSGATAPEWGAASAGLTKITSSSFSAAATVSVNDCFSATYDHYRIIIEAAASAAQDIAQRWRVSGADNTSAIYDYGYVYVTGTAGPTRASANNATSNTWVYNGTGEPSYISVDVYYPFLSTRQTGFTGLSMSYEADSSANYIGGNHNSNASFTGFTLFPKTSGTITGKVTVYGYQI